VKLILSNFRTEVDPREIEIKGNPLLTYDHFRAGDGIPGKEGGSTGTVLEFDRDADAWELLEDGSLWTDVEVIEA